MRTAPLALALMLAATPALAHKLKLFVQAEGDEIVGLGYFAGGGKAMNSPGRVTAPDGTLVAPFTTDGDGRFRLRVTVRQDYTLHLDTGDGHVAETVLRGDELPDSLPAGQVVARAEATPATSASTVPPDIEAALARQLRPLREQIDQMEERARFSDIMGGLGTIFGIFGIAAWVSARRKDKP